MKRLTEKETNNSYKIQGKNLDYHCTSKDKQGYVTYRGEHIDKLAEYEELGYTAEELKLCFNPPNVLYVIGDEYDSTVIHPIYPVDGEQIEFSNGNVYWNCRDIFDDYVALPLAGLHQDYFLTSEEGYDFLNNILVKKTQFREDMII